jgi:3-hydroxybutyryl-CoA dehydrogenase
MGIGIVTVVGGGTMGNGIAHVCALSGRDVTITDLSQDVLDQALKTISKNLDRQVKQESGPTGEERDHRRGPA